MNLIVEKNRRKGAFKIHWVREPCAALEREAHVRAPIVEGEDTSTAVDNKDRTMTAMQNEPPLRLQLFKAARGQEFPARHVHSIPPAVGL
jgi:hypothetical protein